MPTKSKTKQEVVVVCSVLFSHCLWPSAEWALAPLNVNEVIVKTRDTILSHVSRPCAVLVA